jgi:hypothetical protein
MEDIKTKKYISALSIILFLVSLTQKCYCTTSQCGDSILAFALGWAGMFSGGAALAWLANPLLFLSWRMLKKKLQAAMFLSVFATLLALSFLLFDHVIDNEAGHHHKIVSYKAGYWFWVSSSAVMLLGTFFLKLKENTRNAR